MIMQLNIKNSPNRARYVRYLLTMSRAVPILLVIFGVYLLSASGWNDYKTGYDSLFKESKLLINDVLDDGSGGPDDKLENIEKVNSRLGLDMQTFCEISPLIGWQSFLGNLSETVNECNAKKEKLKQLVSDIGSIGGYIADEKTMSEIIYNANVEAEKKNNAGELDKINDIWAEAADSVSRISDDSSQFQATGEYAYLALNKLADAWKKVSDANKAKNRQQFEKARTDLVKVYSVFDDVTEYSKDETIKLIDVLYASYEKI